MKKGRALLSWTTLLVIPLLIPFATFIQGSIRHCPTHWSHCPSTAEAGLDTSPYDTQAGVDTAALKVLMDEKDKCPRASDYIVHTQGAGFVKSGWISYDPSRAEITMQAETKTQGSRNGVEWKWTNVRDDKIKSVISQYGSLQDLQKYGCRKIKIDVYKEMQNSIKALKGKKWE